MTRIRKLNAEDFKSFLKKNRGTVFGISGKTCPLARWLGEEITIEDLDSFPPWANRFDGVFGERFVYVGSIGRGADALRVLREVLA